MDILPQAQRRDEIKFKVVKRLPYNARLILIGFLFVAGLLFQIVFQPNLVAFVIGLALILSAVILGLVKGYQSTPKIRGGKRTFEMCSRQEFEKVLEIDKANRKWDQSFFDITCVTGFLTLIGIGAIVWLVFHYLRTQYPYYAQMWVWDSAVIVAPYWITGVRTILKNPPLIIKIKNLLKLEEYFETIKTEGDTIEHWIELKKSSSGDIPTDAKLMVKFAGADALFLGLQVQIAINNVQGTDYPYMYCVLIARPEFHLHDKYTSVRGLVNTPQSDSEVDIVVVRQKTTRTSGYHTRAGTMKAIFTSALVAARKVLQT